MFTRAEWGHWRAETFFIDGAVLLSLVVLHLELIEAFTQVMETEEWNVRGAG